MPCAVWFKCTDSRQNEGNSQTDVQLSSLSDDTSIMRTDKIYFSRKYQSKVFSSVLNHLVYSEREVHQFSRKQGENKISNSQQ